MYFSSLHGHEPLASPFASGAPVVCRHGTKSPSSPSWSRAARPMRVMIRIDVAT